MRPMPRRSAPLALAIFACALACSSGRAPTPPPSERAVDRTPAERPEGVLAELAMNGGDGTLAALVARLPAGPLRGALPTDLATLLDALVAVPGPIAERVDPASPLRVVIARVGTETRAAIALRLREPVPVSEHEEGGPRGAARVGASAAVDDRVAVVADDPAMLDLVYGYLAYRALDAEVPDGAVRCEIAAAAMATVVRSALERTVEERRASWGAAIAAERARHATPPAFGDPEALVTLASDAARARLAYLPDLGDAHLVLAPSASGLALTLDAPVTVGSPLANALAEHVPVARALVTAAPDDSALVIASGTSHAAIARDAGEASAAVASLGGERLGPHERDALDRAAIALAAARGPESALAIGASDDGAFVSLVTTGAPDDASVPTPWGRDAPFATALVSALAGCDAAPPRTSAEGVAICGASRLVSHAEAGALTAVAARNARERETELRARLAAPSVASPDLARDLDALFGTPTLVMLLRPLRLLPLLASFGGPSGRSLPRGDGALVLGLAHETGTLRVSLRASTAALADLDVVVRLFTE
jgi:hypothetical protein